jgi:hypothetical protein
MRKTRDDFGRIRIDEKHSLEIVNDIPAIIKCTNNQILPDTEPRILFRGRDKIALPLLHIYRYLCTANGCNDYQLNSIDTMIDEFQEFAENSPLTMKKPGITWVEKHVPETGKTYYGLLMFMESSPKLHHTESDDDRTAAITLWFGTKDLAFQYFRDVFMYLHTEV